MSIRPLGQVNLSILSMMVDAIKWILVGLGIGVAVEYARHIASLKELLKLPDFQAEAEEAQKKASSLESLVPSLKADVEAHLKTIAKLEADLKSKPAVAETSVEIQTPVETATLDQITSLSPQFRALLIESGVTSPDQLSAKSEAELLDIVQAQPWDLVNPGDWITEAQSLSTGTVPVASSSTGQDDLHALPGITKQQATALQNSSLATFAAISLATESQLLEAVEAMPWDIVNAEEWISYAKSQA
ncbi:MAG: hypothetical protein KF824_00080 [Fimbriimonadaceae bacterium]|nr:MAG: hypothetical protein KF824_00080 [Fimbriimonadaceae bacterium]